MSRSVQLRTYRQVSGDLRKKRSASRVPARLRSRVAPPEKAEAAHERAEKALRQRAAQLSALYRMGRHLSAMHSVRSVVSAAMKEVVRVARPDLALFYLCREEALRLHAAFPKRARHTKKETEIRAGECLCGLVLRYRRPIFSSDIHSDPRCTLDACKKAGLQSFAALPVPAAGKMLGVLGLAWKDRHEFDGEGRFLETLARQVAVALRNAGLHEELQRQAEALRENQERYMRLLATMPAAVVIHAPDSRIVFSNARAQKILGLTARRMLGKKDTDPAWHFVRPDGSQMPISEYPVRQVLSTGKPVYDQIGGIIRPGKKETTWVVVSAFPCYGPKRRLESVVVSFMDITRRIEAERALQESEARYRAFFEQSPDSIVVIDPETARFVLFNEKAHKNLGYTRAEFEKLTIADIEAIESPADVRRHLDKIVRQGWDSFETQQRTKTGEIRDVHVLARIITIGGKKYNQCIWRDITARKRADGEILAYQDRLRSLASEFWLAQERQRRSIAMYLHDQVGQDLTLAQVKLEELRRSAAGAEISAALDEVRHILNQAIRDTRSVTFELSPPILYEVGLEGALRWLCAEMQRKHGLICRFTDDERPKPVNSELRIALFMAVRELLFNVVKHARARSARVSVCRRRGEVVITVEDDGVGFRPTEVRAVKRGAGGFGLFSVKERMNYLGGSVLIESEPGKGTRVTLAAPLQRGQKA